MLLVLCFLCIYFFICFGGFYLFNFWGVLYVFVSFVMFWCLFIIFILTFCCFWFGLSFDLSFSLLPVVVFTPSGLIIFHVVVFSCCVGLVWFHFVSFCFSCFLVIAHLTIISIAMNFPHSWHRECRGKMCWLYSVASSSSSSLMHILFFNFSYIWMLKWSSYVLLYSTLIAEILDSDWAIAPMWCQINIIMVLSSLCSLSFHKYKISISCLFVYMQRHIISNIKYI